MARKQPKQKFPKGSRVKIGTGSAGGIPSVDDYVGIIEEGPTSDNRFLVSTDDGIKVIHASRLSLA